VPLPPDIVAGIARHLAEHAGFELPAWVVQARAAARIEALDVTPEAYLELIESRAEEIDELIEAVRVGESRLFRHRSQIAVLADVVAPQLQGRRTIRVWSAGCAAGEEPYTLAIVLAKALPGATISILATDVSGDALAAAAAAAYPRAALDDVPDEWRDGFVVEAERIRVRPDLARLVRFERANLLDGAAPRDCDLVWCRNVLIYFTQAARATAIERLVAATRPGGFVFVGYSESLRELPQLEPRRAGEIVYYERREEARVRTTPVPPGLRVVSPPVPTPPVGTPVVRPPPRAPSEEVIQLVGAPEPAPLTSLLAQALARSGLARVVVDLDRADLLADELAAVLRRARAAARAAHIELVLRATRTGARRWLSRHGLEEAG
jgi:chemotaxis protein methyltransferase CheR